MKIKFCLFSVILCLMLSFSSLPTFASSEDNLDSIVTEESADEEYYDNQAESSKSYNSGLTDYLESYTPVTDDNIKSASTVASPIVNLIGNLVGFIVLVTAGLIVLVTSLDLLYIGVPFVRPYLNPNYSSQQGGGAMGSPMMGGGMMGGGMMGGSMMGGGMPQQGSGGKHCWVSDEALACAPQPAGQSGMQGGMMGGGMMGGMMGGSMMGGGMAGGQQQQQPVKSYIMTYLKKRAFFLVIFTVATIVLTSSVFTDCGINLAQLVFKVMNKVNGALEGFSV